MNNYIQQTEAIIGDIKRIDKAIKGELKAKILELAKHIEKGLNEKRPEIMNKAKLVRGGDEPTPKIISKIIKRIRDEHFSSVSVDYITKVLPDKYKESRPEVETDDEVDETKLMQIVEDNMDRVKNIIKNSDRGPAKEPKFKDRDVEEFEKYTWSCWIAQEMARLAIKMENEHKHKHDHSMCQEYAKRVKTVRDKRFATPLNHYEGMLVAMAAGASISEVAKGEWQHIDRWTLKKNEENCSKCFGAVDCANTSCKCKCHRTVIPMTTKGVKYAINNDRYLKDLDKELKEMMIMDDDLCRIGKMILKNSTTNKYLKKDDKERVINEHIEKNECLKCEMYLDKHPGFFEDGE